MKSRFTTSGTPVGKGRIAQAMTALIVLFAFTLSSSVCGFAGDKKKKDKANQQSSTTKAIDYSYIVWPNPPAIPRIRYINWYASDRRVRNLEGKVQKKQGWMDRLAGTQSQDEVFKLPFSLVQPNGVAVDSEGRIYTADSKVGAVFIFNPETHNVDLIKHRTHANFNRIVGLAMDDNDRLFVSDPGLHHVLVFNRDHHAEDVISEGMVEPGDMAIDRQSRLLYVSDVELDQVLVYDADTLKLLRKLGTTGQHHALTTPGDFSRPTGVAVDADGNLYVCDTMNNRIEVFDADGTFIREFGKPGDSPGYLARPKGVAIDSDGHIWIADGQQDRVQVFNQENQLLIAYGGHGLLPGQFSGLVNITSDPKTNRIITSEIYPGRLQAFRYITEAEAEKMRQERAAQRISTAQNQKKDANSATTATQPVPSEPAKTPPPK